MPKILIVGAGISGLALARALALRGMTAELAERNDQWSTVGAGLYLPANAVRALTMLGLGEELTRRAAGITVQHILDRRGRRLVEIDLREVWGEVGDCLAISRGDLHEVLRGAVDPQWITLGLAVTTVSEEGLVTFADGSSRSYDLVVGADGIHSAVRQSLFPGIEPRFLNQVCWRFIAEARPDISGWTVRTGSGGRAFLTVELGEGRVYCYAESASSVQTPPEGDWRSLFADFADPVPDLLTQGAEAYYAPLAEIGGSDWVRQNVVLVGDAAHACSPSMAQGGAMALEDVLSLAELVATQPLSQALAAYKTRRVSRIEWVLEQNHRRDRARALPTPLRNTLFRLAGKKLVKSAHVPLLPPP